MISPDAKLTPWPDSIKPWDQLTDVEKKLFIKQADVYGAYLAYTDHEVGRMVQAVESLGKADNTIIIYISGDNRAFAESSAMGTFNEAVSLNAIELPAAEQMAWCDSWGSSQTYPTARSVGPGRWTRRSNGPSKSRPSSAAQAGHGHLLAGEDQGQGCDPLAVHHVIDILPTCWR